MTDHTLDFVLPFSNHIFLLEKGYWLKFEIRRVDHTPQRPHGLSYSFTLHAPDGRRLIGFDNSHTPARPAGSRFAKKSVEYDHWHRTQEDEGRPYRFVDADKLLADFFAAVRRELSKLGVSDDVTAITMPSENETSAT
jgi:hypothetical protein